MYLYLRGPMIPVLYQLEEDSRIGAWLNTERGIENNVDLSQSDIGRHVYLRGNRRYKAVVVEPRCGA